MAYDQAGRERNCNCRSWESYAGRHTRTRGSTRKRLKLIAGKLRSRWDGPYVVTNIFPYGVVEVRDVANNRTFKVSEHQLKPYHEGPKLNSTMGEVEIITLPEPVIPKDPPEEVPESLNA
ncbi:hypothetical protein CR513_06549, partial [Mucuna pruriens]